MDERSDERRPTSGEQPAGEVEHGRRDGAQIDAHQLADKVYQLMLVEARLARARGEEAIGRGKS